MKRINRSMKQSTDQPLNETINGSTVSSSFQSFIMVFFITLSVGFAIFLSCQFCCEGAKYPFCHLNKQPPAERSFSTINQSLITILEDNVVDGDTEVVTNNESSMMADTPETLSKSETFVTCKDSLENDFKTTDL
jgi:hypothetical protein